MDAGFALIPPPPGFHVCGDVIRSILSMNDCLMLCLFVVCMVGDFESYLSSSLPL